jgi:hypothetical protein
VQHVQAAPAHSISLPLARALYIFAFCHLIPTMWGFTFAHAYSAAAYVTDSVLVSYVSWISQLPVRLGVFIMSATTILLSLVVVIIQSVTAGKSSRKNVPLLFLTIVYSETTERSTC